MNKTKLALLLVGLFSFSMTHAEVTLTLQGDYIKIGTSEYGTIGSKSNTPPGMLYDNTGTGTFNAAYDYLTPGTPFEGWTVKFTNDAGSTVSVTNNNTGAVGVTGGILTNYSGIAYNGTTFDNRAVWTGGNGNFDLTNDVRFNDNQKFVDITTSLTAKVNMTNLYFGRFIDPDARAAAGDSSATNNTLGYSLTDGTVVLTNKQVVMSEALASKYALGLYTAADNAGAGISNAWTTDPTNYYNNVNSGNGDYTIGIAFLVPTLATGSTATFNYAYIFGPTRLAANETAVSSGAGGGTAGVIPGCTSDCTIPGFDTSGGGSPTITGTSTVNGTSIFSDINGDSSVSSLSIISANYLTRDYYDVTTTLIGRTTTTPTTVITTYSDSSTTSAAGTPIVATENYYHIIDITSNDVATSAVADAASRTHVDTGSVTLATPEVTASADFSTRTGSATTSGTIARETTTPTLFTYDRTTTTVTTNDFGSSSSYTDTTNTATTTSTVSATYNIITNEDFTRTVTKDVLDTMTASEAYAPYTRVSNGVYGSILAEQSAIATATTSKNITLTAHIDYSALERFTKTTPTTFTYNRAVTTTTADTFGAGSVYTNTSTPVTVNSTVIGNYNVITTEYDPIDAKVDFNLSARTDQSKVTTDVHSLINRNTEFGKSINYKLYDHGIAGYNGRSNQFGFGYTKDIVGDMTLGIGINKINTSLAGNKSNMRTDALQIGATLSKEVKGFDLKATVQHSWIDYDISTTPTLSITGLGDSRLLPSYAILGTRTVDAGKISTSTSGTDSSVMFRATGPGTYVRPVAGATFGYRQVGSFNTRWDIVPGLSRERRTDAESEIYGFATFGATAKYGILNATALYHTDNVKQFGLGLEKTSEKLTFNIRADRLETKDGGSNVYTANMIYQF